MQASLILGINSALLHALENDANIVLFGQDIAQNGGVFRATEGLMQKFPKQVFNSPISEVLMTGMGTGMAIAKLKPIIEFQFSGFMLSAIEQLLIHAGRMRSRTRSRLHCPMVIRAPYGSGIGAPEHHSESPEALFAHIPGIRVVIPATAQRAHGLLLAAIDEPDPVVILEPKKLYHRQSAAIQVGLKTKLDQAFIEKTGTDLSIITWGAMLPLVKEITEKLTNINCEVIDLCSISPIDHDTIINSVKKTGRALVVHEACQSFGVGAEILAIIAEHCTPYLIAPPKRLTGFDIPTPYFKNEHQYFPQAKQIINAIRKIMEYHYA